jgi:hypothetical protein
MTAIVNIDQHELNQRHYPLSIFESVSDFFNFIMWTTGERRFQMTIKGKQFEISVFPEMSGRGWMAVEDGMYGGEPGSIFSYHSMQSKEDALSGLVEKLSTAIYEEKL